MSTLPTRTAVYPLSNRLQLPEQQRPFRKESTASGSTSKAAKSLLRWSNLWLQDVSIYAQRAHTGLQKHQHCQPNQLHCQDTERRQQGGQERVFNTLTELNKALNIRVLVSKTQEQWTKSVMGLNGSGTAGIAGNSSQHREDLFTYLMVIYTLARAASALNVYHHCCLHLWLLLCHPMTRYFLVLTANSDMFGTASYTNLTACCL